MAERSVPYPAFLADAFPAALMDYVAPLFRSRGGCPTQIVFSVDWEKDHGRWRASHRDADYGGVLRGTPVLCDLLDEFDIPCTWFVECNREFPACDMPSACPDAFRQIAARHRDEIGLHPHWGNYERPGGAPADLRDSNWVARTLADVTEHLRREAERSVVSFRSGGHMAVPRLPEILDRLGYRFDGSVEDRRSTRKRRLHAMLGLGTDAYHPQPGCTFRVGDCPLWEVPTSLHLHGFAALQRVWRRLFPMRRQRIISVYLHIDELTEPDSGPSEAARIDRERLAGLRSLLAHWAAQPDLEWVTAQQAVARLGAERGDALLAREAAGA